MDQTIINEIVQGMLPFLDNRQMEELKKVLEYTLYGKTVVDTQPRSRETTENENRTLMDRFIAAKRIEGCSEKSLKY